VVGECLALREIQQQATDEMNHRHYMKEEKDALIQELAEFCEDNQKGACASNKAAAMDMRVILENIRTEVSQGLDILFCGDSQLNQIRLKTLQSIPVAKHLHSLRVAMSMIPQYQVHSRQMIHCLSSMRCWVLHPLKSLGNWKYGLVQRSKVTTH